MLKGFKALYVNPLFYKITFAISGLFFLSYWIPSLYGLSWTISGVYFFILIFEVYKLYSGPSKIEAQRILPQKFSNSDENIVIISVRNNSQKVLEITIIDELPFQFQKRDFLKNLKLQPQIWSETKYTVVPKERGEYIFGQINVYEIGIFGLFKKRHQFMANQKVKVYPSFIQMQQYDFKAFSKSLEYGIKKIRRLGHTTEFEQIKEYVKGDDFRTINWKATAKKNQLMVNQFLDEKSQPIYSLIDCGRIMKMPFNGLTLLDYAINSTLAFSNIAIKKKDKVGMATFSNTSHTFLPAKGKISQLQKIMESLYQIDTQFYESDFGKLYIQVKKHIKHRSLLFLFTNFEHISGLNRQMPYVRALAKKHHLVVVMFQNSELIRFMDKNTENLGEVYHKIIAEKMYKDKRHLKKELEKHGINCILTEPKNLTIDTINKYLELKMKMS